MKGMLWALGNDKLGDGCQKAIVRYREKYGTPVMCLVNKDDVKGEPLGEVDSVPVKAHKWVTPGHCIVTNEPQ